MLTILAPLLVFGLVVFVHELGHFIAAKSVGVYAPRFSIGFGPALFKRRRGETEYVIAALPLGGYVRMASREDEATAFLEGGSETAAAAHVGVVTANDAPAVLGGAPDPVRPKDWDPEAMIPFGPKPVPEHRWFESKGLLARIWILSAGVMMNVLLTFVVCVILAGMFGRQIIPTTVIGFVRTTPLAADLPQRLAVGDRVESVAGRPVTTWNEVERAMIAAPGDTIEIATSGGAVRVAGGKPRSDERTQLVRAIAPLIPAVIDSVSGGSPALRAGMRAGDSIVAVDGRPVRSFPELVSYVQPRPGDTLQIDVIRAGAPVRLVARADSVREADPETGRERVVGRIGAGPRDVSRREAIGAGEAVRTGWNTTWAMGGAVLRTVRGLVSREVSVKQLGGPIAIARTSVAAARGGVQELFYLIAFLSINIAILNLLPIPVLDGGQILLNIAESVKGSPFSPGTREWILRIGLAAILLLFVTVMWNDIVRLIAGGGQ